MHLFDSTDAYQKVSLFACNKCNSRISQAWCRWRHVVSCGSYLIKSQEPQALIPTSFSEDGLNNVAIWVLIEREIYENELQNITRCALEVICLKVSAHLQTYIPGTKHLWQRCSHCSWRAHRYRATTSDKRDIRTTFSLHEKLWQYYTKIYGKTTIEPLIRRWILLILSRTPCILTGVHVNDASGLSVG